MLSGKDLKGALLSQGQEQWLGCVSSRYLPSPN